MKKFVYSLSKRLSLLFGTSQEQGSIVAWQRPGGECSPTAVARWRDDKAIIPPFLLPSLLENEPDMNECDEGERGRERAWITCRLRSHKCGNRKQSTAHVHIGGCLIPKAAEQGRYLNDVRVRITYRVFLTPSHSAVFHTAFQCCLNANLGNFSALPAPAPPVQTS